MPNESVCYPPCAARYFAERSKAKLFLGTPVTTISDTGVTTQNGAHIPAATTIVATGARSPEVTPRKGHLLITDRYPGFLSHILIELGYLKSAHSTSADSVAFNAQPRPTGQILLGSSRQYGATDPGVDKNMLANMLRRALEYMPALSKLRAIRTWTGFRAATPNKLPIVDRHPQYKNVYVNTGHEGLGISTSLATARLIADQVLNRDSAIPRQPYAYMSN